MFFNCVLHQQQASILSLMSDPIIMDEPQQVTKMKKYSRWHFRTECTKEFLNLLREKKPEYLLLDFYGDVYCGVGKLDENNYFTNNYKFREFSPLKDNVGTLSIENDTDQYLDLWTNSINTLFATIEKTVPDCKVILVSSRFKDKVDDGRNCSDIRKARNMRVIDIEKMNRLWDRLDNYVKSNFKVDVIDMTEKNYRLDSKHLWGIFYVHYTKDFYHDFFNKLQLIVQKDLTNALKKENKQTSKINNKLKKTEDQVEKLQDENKKLKKRIKFFEDESFIHVIKRYLLKIRPINDLNNKLRNN